MPSYDLCPNVGIPDITRQIAKATTHAAHRITGPICLAGHSAGGHLVARMVCEGVLPEDIAARLQTVLPISPLSDLRPLMSTSMNADFDLDEKTAKAESPIFSKPVSGANVIVWVGADERPVFIEQAQWLSEAWHTDLHIEKGRHHFDVIDALADRESEMGGLLNQSA
jgi:acetyl esterase/lipase